MITYYNYSNTVTNVSNGSLMKHGSRAILFEKGDGYYKDPTFELSSDNLFTTQIGYGTKPLTADKVEAFTKSTKSYDTTKGVSDITGETANGKVSFNAIMDKIRKELYIPTSSYSYSNHLKTLARRYNRFKLPNSSVEIKKGIGHVFFCRPMCNLLDASGQLKLSVASEGAFQDIFEQNSDLVREISANNNAPSDFMYILSNYAKGFSLNDEELQSNTYGNTYTGYKISYGKTNIESKTAGSFSVTYNDDKSLSIYKIHRMWTDYINAVYRGRLDPDMNSIANKILDYVGSVYYIMTAEDNETILFWSKYYGVYPVTIPSSQYSWSAGSFVDPQAITIQYNYSWKEDFSISSIAEFNTNARVQYMKGTNPRYVPTFDTNTCFSGPTIVGTPYIEKVYATDSDNGSLAYSDQSSYKLRFVPDELM